MPLIREILKSIVESSRSKDSQIPWIFRGWAYKNYPVSSVVADLQNATSISFGPLLSLGTCVYSNGTWLELDAKPEERTHKPSRLFINTHSSETFTSKSPRKINTATRHSSWTQSPMKAVPRVEFLSNKCKRNKEGKKKKAHIREFSCSSPSLNLLQAVPSPCQTLMQIKN